MYFKTITSCRLDEATKRLYKDMKKCIEAMGTLSKTQCRIGHNMAASPVMNTEEYLKPLELISKSIGKVEELTTELVSIFNQYLLETVLYLCILVRNNKLGHF